MPFAIPFQPWGWAGFSTHDASFGYFNSPAIEAVAIVFMLIAGMNFGTLFLAVSGRSLKPLPPRSGGRLVPWRYLAEHRRGRHVHLEGWGLSDLDTAIRHVAFNLISIATTTGFASVDYALWPIFAPLWMLFLSSFATSAGSTGGGIKMMRATAALQAGLSGTGARHAPERRLQHSYRRSDGAAAHPVRGAFLRLHVHGQYRLI